MAEKFYNVGKQRILECARSTTALDPRVLLVITSTTGADNQDLTTVAAIDAVGTVAFHSERITLGNETTNVDQANDRAGLDTDNAVFAIAAGVSALAAIVYDEAGAGADSGRIPISYHDTGFPKPLDGGLTLNIADLWRAL